MSEKCRCGHYKTAHIYEEGACRPGFVCEAGCDMYVPVKAEPKVIEVMDAFERLIERDGVRIIQHLHQNLETGETVWRDVFKVEGVLTGRIQDSLSVEPRVTAISTEPPVFTPLQLEDASKRALDSFVAATRRQIEAAFGIPPNAEMKNLVNYEALETRVIAHTLSDHRCDTDGPEVLFGADWEGPDTPENRKRAVGSSASCSICGCLSITRAGGMG
jgi:hypothetical protein